MYGFDEVQRALRTTESMVRSKHVVYTNGADENGDFDGAGNPQVLFTVTGTVLLAIVAVCTVLVTDAGGTSTIEVGDANFEARYLPQTQNTSWAEVGGVLDATGFVNPGAAEIPHITPNQIALDGDVIQATVGTEDMTGGEITYLVFYKPLTRGAGVTVA